MEFEQVNSAWENVVTYKDHSVWSRIADGQLIYVVMPNGQTPAPDAGGYFTIQAALKLKGLK